MEHAAVRALHADLIADRVAELGGYPDFAPERAAAALQALELRGSTIAEALTEYEAQLADDTESHREMIRRIGNADVRTRAMLETIVLEEQDHLMQLAGIREELRRTDLVY